MSDAIGPLSTFRRYLRGVLKQRGTRSAFGNFIEKLETSWTMRQGFDMDSSALECAIHVWVNMLANILQIFTFAFVLWSPPADSRERSPKPAQTLNSVAQGGKDWTPNPD